MRPFHLLALDTWHDEIQAGERSPHTRDPLFWAASKCADAVVAAEIDWHIQASFYDDIYKIGGMNIVFVIENSSGREASMELLRELGMPFARS